MNSATSNVGSVKVFTTQNRGFTPEEIAERALEKIIYVGEKSHPVIVEQAKAFREHIRQVLIQYLQEAQESERLTICGLLNSQGHSDLADIIRRL